MQALTLQYSILVEFKTKKAFNRFIYLFCCCCGCLLLNPLNTQAKKKTTGNFKRGECLGSPHTGYGPGIKANSMNLSHMKEQVLIGVNGEPYQWLSMVCGGVKTFLLLVLLSFNSWPLFHSWGDLVPSSAREVSARHSGCPLSRKRSTFDFRPSVFIWNALSTSNFQDTFGSLCKLGFFE